MVSLRTTVAFVLPIHDPDPRDSSPMKDLPVDFRDFLVALFDAGARFVVVGGYAVAFHGHVRATKDLDVYVEPEPKNSLKVERALVEFGAPLRTLGIDAKDFRAPGSMVQLGVPPLRIDLVTSIDGVSFDDAWQDHEVIEIDGRKVPVIGLTAL